MAKYLDLNGLAYVWDKITNKFVAKETGKGLSSNDYTSDEKTKLSGIEAEANKYVLPYATKSTAGGVIVGSGISVTNGVISADTQEGTKNYNELTESTLPQINSITLKGNKSLDDLGIASKTSIPSDNKDLANGAGYITASALDEYALESDIPTNNNQLDNGAGYITSSALQTYATQQYVADAVQGKKATYVYQNKAALDTALTDTFKATLKVGDVFLLIATDEPDYWWTADGSSGTLAELQSRTFDFETITNGEIDDKCK